ncbi:hypothetical protein NSS71_08325 [Niallia sp. FSL W8-0951]|uniref:hypothetical protein n=1 Tax=Niallia sp. FSL W8-0951 TaxID=2954639 RepID=UPI0030F7F089
MSNIINLNDRRIEKMYIDFYKHGGLDLRLDNVPYSKINGKVVRIRKDSSAFLYKTAR